MQLAEWIKNSGKTRKQVASELGLSPASITALCAGTTWPGRDVAARIAELTVGQVTANDFVPTNNGTEAA
jgi:3,4-dihydroxy 2-butanone 4-phosphate synthase/GTP cyclohydrolase II